MTTKIVMQPISDDSQTAETSRWHLWIADSFIEYGMVVERSLREHHFFVGHGILHELSWLRTLKNRSDGSVFFELSEGSRNHVLMASKRTFMLARRL